jgi:hypothetical protein
MSTETVSNARIKPIMSFRKFFGMDGSRAILGDVKQHPRLGDADRVQTSTVQEIKRDDSGRVVRVETLNSIYVQERTEIAIGDRVRVVKPDACNYGDYEAGNTAVVERIDIVGGLYVRWEKIRFENNPDRESGRCNLLFPGEVEVIS